MQFVYNSIAKCNTKTISRYCEELQEMKAQKDIACSYKSCSSVDYNGWVH